MTELVQQLPVLYSFRRCPYAIRARMTLCHCSIPVELREVLLADKPRAMLLVSPKGTVPILVLNDGSVLDQSLAIMYWAIRSTYPDANDANNWLAAEIPILGRRLIEANDTEFKRNLDAYKYQKANDSRPPSDYRTDAERFLVRLEYRLQSNRFLMADTISLVDIAIFPFIRQFAGVDPNWFEQTPYAKLRGWLACLLQSELFLASMTKHPVWQQDESSQN